MSSPFWDPGAAQPSTPNPGQITYPAIWSIVPESASQALPDGLSPWEVIYFAGLRAPGVARVTGGRRRIVDRIGTPGATGETVNVMGMGLADFFVTLTIWTDRQKADAESLIKKLLPKPTARPQTASQTSVAPFLVQPLPNISSLAIAFDVRHPLIQMHGVNTVHVVSIDGPHHVGSQIFELGINCIEFQQPLNEGVTVMRASSSEPAPATARTPPPDPSQTNTQP